MRANPSHRKVRAIPGALLTLLAIGLLAPGSARGDCRHPGDRPAIALEGFGLEGSRVDPAPMPMPMPAPRPKPCDGPQCSGKTAPPVAPAPSTIPPRSEAWGLAIEPAPVAPPGPSGRAVEDALARPIRLATSIFHPPRLPR